MASRLLFLDRDARLLDQIRKGGEDALVELYRTSRKQVTAYVIRNSGSVEDAEDLLQEALVILWERVRTGRFELSAKLETFIVATVRNIWLRRLARMRREKREECDPDGRPDDAPSPLEVLIEDERSARVRDALGTLGEPCRTILLLFYWEELPMEKIAERIGLANAETAKSKKYQCKKALEALLRQAAGGGDD